MVTEQGREPREVARDLGICIDTLRNWLKGAGMQLGLTVSTTCSIRNSAVPASGFTVRCGPLESFRQDAGPIRSQPTPVQPFHCPNLLKRNFFFEQPKSGLGEQYHLHFHKCELIHLKHYLTRGSAQVDIFAYLEAFCNSPTIFCTGLAVSNAD